MSLVTYYLFSQMYGNIEKFCEGRELEWKECSCRDSVLLEVMHMPDTNSIIIGVSEINGSL